MEVSGQLHAPAALPPGKEPRYALDRRLDGPQSRSGRCGEEKNLYIERKQIWYEGVDRIQLAQDMGHW
jgi:hypothetical protein